MQQVWLYAQHRLYYDVFDLEHEDVHIMPRSPEPVEHCLERPFVPFIVQSVFRVLEARIVLIDRVVREVNEHVVDIR